MRERTYRNYKNKKSNDCNIKINDYNVSYVINKIAKEQNISKSKLIENLIYEKYPGYFHKIPESLDSIISNLEMHLEEGNCICSTDADLMEYILGRLKNLKNEEKKYE